MNRGQMQVATQQAGLAIRKGRSRDKGSIMEWIYMLRGRRAAGRVRPECRRGRQVK